MKYKQQDFWTVGRRGTLACIRCIVYDDGKVMANADADKLTPAQMSRALRKEFGLGFQRAWLRDDKDTICMDSIREEQEHALNRNL